MNQSGRIMPVGGGIVLQPELLRNLIAAHGEPALETWLQALPEALGPWCARWKVRISSELPASGYNLMFYGQSGIAGPVVLKLNLPSPEVHSELEAIAQTSGQGIVRLVDADPDLAIIMLERVDPGTPLRTAGLTDRESCAVGADVMRRFWRPPARPDNLFTLRRWSDSLFGYPGRSTYPDGPIPALLIDRAIETAEQLLSTQSDLVLLHGDIHHDNILWGGDQGWVTIDPKGLIGERGFDIGTWMHNPPHVGLRSDIGMLLRNRIDTFSHLLALDPHRTAQWCFMFLVLSMCWTTEDEGFGDLTSDMMCALEMGRIMDDLAR